VDTVVSNYDKVKEFHTSFSTQMSPALAEKLIHEEYNELLDELWAEPQRLELIAKELTDLLYVTYGLAYSLNLDIDKIFDEVHRSNMSKLGDDGNPIYREDGKILKGPNYSPANLEGLV
jgi:predicted HAD superfamily Cof-like phosphohydrolase